MQYKSANKQRCTQIIENEQVMQITCNKYTQNNSNINLKYQFPKFALQLKKKN